MDAGRPGAPSRPRSGARFRSTCASDWSARPRRQPAGLVAEANRRSVEGLPVATRPPEARTAWLDNIVRPVRPGSRIATHTWTCADPVGPAQKMTERSQRIGSNMNLAESFYTGDRIPPPIPDRARRWRAT